MPPRSRGFRPGCAVDEDGGRGAPGRRCFSKRWVTTRRSSLGDFGHSRLALRHEGSDRHRGYHPTDPTGEGCPSSHRARLPPSVRMECPCPVARSFHPTPARRVAPAFRRGRKSRVPQSRREKSPRPTLPVALSGPWGSALLLRALRRSRTRPRRSPGRASSPPRASGCSPLRQAAFRRPPGTADWYSTGAGAASPPRHRPLRKRPLLGGE